MTTTSYFLSFNVKSCVKLRLVEDTHHRCPGAHHWCRVHIAFHSVVLPFMSSQIGLSCILKQTIFICIVDSFSRRDMVPTLPVKFTTVNIVKSLTRTLTCIYSIIHRIRQTIFYNQFLTLEDMPAVLYKILSGAMLSIRPKVDFYPFYNFHMVEFWRCSCGTWVLAISLTLVRNTKTNKAFQEIYTYEGCSEIIETITIFSIRLNIIKKKTT